MARIKGKDTSPEVRLRRLLFARGLRYRVGLRIGRCRPDVVFPGRRVAVFIDGCFWHGCPDHYARPRSHSEFWAQKLLSNVERDRRQTLRLESEGWIVIRVWEHDVVRDADGAADAIFAAVRGLETQREQHAWRVWRVVASRTADGVERRDLVDLRQPETIRSVEGPRVVAKERGQNQDRRHGSNGLVRELP